MFSLDIHDSKVCTCTCVTYTHQCHFVSADVRAIRGKLLASTTNTLADARSSREQAYNKLEININLSSPHVHALRDAIPSVKLYTCQADQISCIVKSERYDEGKPKFYNLFCNLQKFPLYQLCTQVTLSVCLRHKVKNWSAR